MRQFKLYIISSVIILFALVGYVRAEVTPPRESKTSALNMEFITNLMRFADHCIEDEDYWLAEEVYSLVVLVAENKDEISKTVEKLRRNIEAEDKIIEDNYRQESHQQSEGFYKSGLELAKASKYSEAVTAFEQALAFRREFPEAGFKLGECYEKLEENRKSIAYYRLCAKYLQQQSPRSKEQDELLVQVGKCLNRLDDNWKLFSQIKSEHIKKLLSSADEYMKKKYESSVSQLLQRSVKIDPANIKTNEFILQISVPPLTSTEASGYWLNLFNGRDLTGWGANAYWRVEKGRLIAEPPEKKTADMLWQGRVPRNFSLYITCYIEPSKYKREQLIGFYTGVFKVGKLTFKDIIYPPAGRLVPGHNHVEYIMKNGTSKFVINGKVTEVGGTTINGSTMTETLLGLGVQSGCIYFERIILAEFD
ncbi:MAG: hypothetical protein WC980_10395 [Candidatus Brocadiia bacterium]